MVPYRLWRFSHKFEHPKSTPYYFSLSLILSVTPIYHMCTYTYQHMYTLQHAACKYLWLRKHVPKWLCQQTSPLVVPLAPNQVNTEIWNVWTSVYIYALDLDTLQCTHYYIYIYINMQMHPQKDRTFFQDFQVSNSSIWGLLAASYQWSKEV